MRRLVTALCLALPLAASALPADAASRPLSRSMTCAQAKNLVARSGGIVINTDRYIYDRYVADARFCMRGQTTRPAWAPTRDDPECFIGYTCVEPEPDWWW